MNTKTATCLTFAVTPEPGKGSGPSRFRGIAYSGGLIPQYGFYGDSAIDLSSMSLPDGKLFALVDHDPEQFNAGGIQFTLPVQLPDGYGTGIRASNRGRYGHGRNGDMGLSRQNA